MFNFTTTTIVNAVNGALPTDFSKGDISKESLYIKNVGSFKADEITSLTKKEASDEVPAEATLTVSDVTEGAIYRLTVDIELYKSESSLYARPWSTKGKAIYAEAIAGTTAADLAAKLVTNINKYMNLVYDKSILTVSNEGAVITVKGVEGTQVLKSIVLEKWVDDAATVSTYAGGKWVSANVGEVTVDPKHGFGTYKHLIHNIVLPTYENMKYGNAVANSPKLGSKYDQYVITKRVKRDPYGTGAVGQELVSVTQHVFWVESSVSSAFATLFGVKEGGKVLDENDTNNDGYELVSVLDD